MSSLHNDTLVWVNENLHHLKVLLFTPFIAGSLLLVVLVMPSEQGLSPIIQWHNHGTGKGCTSRIRPGRHQEEGTGGDGMDVCLLSGQCYMYQVVGCLSPCTIAHAYAACTRFWVLDTLGLPGSWPALTRKVDASPDSNSSIAQKRKPGSSGIRNQSHSVDTGLYKLGCSQPTFFCVFYARICVSLCVCVFQMSLAWGWYRPDKTTCATLSCLEAFRNSGTIQVWQTGSLATLSQ
jgi:hypothetical protein